VLGRLYLSIGDYAAAITHFRKVSYLNTKPASSTNEVAIEEAQYGLAICYRLTGRPEDAITLLEEMVSSRAIVRGASVPRLLQELSGAYVDAGKLQEALAPIYCLLDGGLNYNQYRQSIRRPTETHDPRWEAARIWDEDSLWANRDTQHDKIDEPYIAIAVPMLDLLLHAVEKRHLQDDATVVACAVQLAVAFMNIQRYDRAIPLLEGAELWFAHHSANWHPDTAAVRGLLGLSYRGANRPSDAERLLRDAQRNPQLAHVSPKLWRRIKEALDSRATTRTS
jgi:tetratricopeptide (TPR) repeat protein